MKFLMIISLVLIGTQSFANHEIKTELKVYNLQLKAEAAQLDKLGKCVAGEIACSCFDLKAGLYKYQNELDGISFFNEQEEYERCSSLSSVAFTAIRAGFTTQAAVVQNQIKNCQIDVAQKSQRNAVVSEELIHKIGVLKSIQEDINCK